MSRCQSSLRADQMDRCDTCIDATTGDVDGRIKPAIADRLSLRHWNGSSSLIGSMDRHEKRGDVSQHPPHGSQPSVIHQKNVRLSTNA